MPPAGWGFSYMDVMGGWMGSLALIMGLLQARKTGQGFYVDYAVTEGAMSLLGTYMLDYQVNGRTTRRPGFPPGNRSVWPAVAPHNTYRCSGKDRVGQDWWVFIACETQAQFESLCRLMGQPELCADPRFATNEARVANQDALDAIVGRWMRPRRRYDVMQRCQEAGIIAAVVQSAEDRVEHDPQLKHRDMHPVDRPSGDRRLRVRGLSGQALADAGLRARAGAAPARAQPLRLRRAARPERRGDDVARGRESDLRRRRWR